MYGVSYYYNTVTFYAGHATFAINSLGQDDKTLTRAKLKSFTATWERTSVNKALAGDVPAAGTNIIFGGRHFQWPDYYSGLMHGFFHSLAIYDQAVSVDILAMQDFTSKLKTFINNSIQLIVRALADSALGTTISVMTTSGTRITSLR